MSKSISLVLSGYYGYDNIGDEAILTAILQQLQQVGITPIVLSGNPKETTARYGVQAVDRMKLSSVIDVIRQSDGLISGGGSLLQDTTSARNPFYYLGVMNIAHWLKKPVFCFAQGIGPLERKWIHPFVRSVLNRCAFLSVRDPMSKTLLETIGVKKEIVLTADPAFALQGTTTSSLPPTIEAFLRKKPLLLSIRQWGKGDDTLQAVTTLIHRLRQQQIPILLLPFHAPHDTELAKEIQQSFADDPSVMVAEHVKNVKDFNDIVNKGYMMVGMRLHALVFAANQGIPFIGISYDPKVDAFLQLFNKESATDTHHWDMERVYEQIMYTYTHYEEEQATIARTLYALQEQLYQPILYITTYFKEDLHGHFTRDSFFRPYYERNHRHIN